MAYASTRKTFPGVQSGRYNIEGVDLSVNVKVTGTQATPTDCEDVDLVTFAVNLRVVTGGTSPTLAFKAQTSPDGALWFEAGNIGGTLTAPGTVMGSLTGLMRYNRIAWTIAGTVTPTTATADLYITAKRR